MNVSHVEVEDEVEEKKENEKKSSLHKFVHVIRITSAIWSFKR